MIGAMSKRKKPGPAPSGTAKERGPILYLRLDDALEAAIQKFIKAQVVPPDRTAVGIIALQQFLERQGLWPPKD